MHKIVHNEKLKVLLAGATGNLGRFITYELAEQKYPSRLIVRNLAKAGLDPIKAIEARGK